MSWNGGEPPTQSARRHRSDGFTLIELLIVIVILGLLAVVVVFAVGGAAAEAEENACAGGARTVATAVEAYFAQHVSDAIPATGVVDGEEYERTLVASGLIRSTSEYWDVQADGGLVSIVPC